MSSSSDCQEIHQARGQLTHDNMWGNGRLGWVLVVWNHAWSLKSAGLPDYQLPKTTKSLPFRALICCMNANKYILQLLKQKISKLFITEYFGHHMNTMQQLLPCPGSLQCQLQFYTSHLECMVKIGSEKKFWSTTQFKGLWFCFMTIYTLNADTKWSMII